MTRQEPTPPEAVLVAIDVSKLRNDVLIEIPGKTRRRRLVVPNTKAEHDRFVDLLRGFGQACRRRLRGDLGTIIAPWPFDCWRKASHSDWCPPSRWPVRERLCTTAGTRTIRRMPRSSCTCSGSVPRRLTSTRSKLASTTSRSCRRRTRSISKAKTELWHRLLTHYLPLYFPEIARFAGNSRSDWFLAFLEQFPTPASITAHAKDGFIEAAWDVVGKKVSKARLLGDIYETAQSSIGLPVAMDSSAIAMFQLVIAEGRSLIRQRDEIEKQAHAALGDNADYQRLRQLPGIGPIHAMTILAEAGDLRRFRHHRQFLKFCGLDLATHQSGQFRGQTKLSKFGNARLRRTFWMAAQVAIRQRDNSFRAKFERYIAKDRDNPDLRRKALTAVTAKMARTAHAVIKTGTDYRPFIEGPMPSGRTSLSRGREGASATL